MIESPQYPQATEPLLAYAKVIDAEAPATNEIRLTIQAVPMFELDEWPEARTRDGMIHMRLPGSNLPEQYPPQILAAYDPSQPFAQRATPKPAPKEEPPKKRRLIL